MRARLLVNQNGKPFIEKAASPDVRCTRQALIELETYAATDGHIDSLWVMVKGERRRLIWHSAFLITEPPFCMPKTAGLFFAGCPYQ